MSAIPPGAAGAALSLFVAIAAGAGGFLLGRREAALRRGRAERLLATADALGAAAHAILASVAAYGERSAHAAGSVKEATETMGLLSHTAMRAALTAESVVGLALHSLSALQGVEGGRRATDSPEAAETIRRLTQALRDSSSAAREIATVAQQQDQGIDRVLRSMNGIFLTVEDAARVTRQVAEQAEALNALAVELRAQVEA
ncbi:hypothetical protein [Anaeromyxobacter paludicola]|uniref:t-SNARE coiled-coil homology domain-containing protein n=1 Tax=Anaeromyxobacter paludicola TaxID=2918171 RepID=A0ABM7XFB0_9BACT|nr:hypothetical protein [Anaeromyxobacter paludicola]BDG10577.1 hypothetical protein AMPC_36900 [Anaeromyxobacter paludicola]